ISQKTNRTDLALQLALAIQHGDEEAATRCAVALARQQATLSILLKETDLLRPPNPPQVFQDYGFHPLVQRWIIGQCLCVDERTVWSYGVRRDGDPAFLYLLSANRAELTRQRYDEDQAQLLLASIDAIGDGGEERRKYGTVPGAAGRKGAMEGSDAGWSCPKCTFINKPTRPGCEMCSTDRPPDYVVPGGYEPDETELWRMQQEQEGMLRYQQVKGGAVGGSGWGGGGGGGVGGEEVLCCAGSRLGIVEMWGGVGWEGPRRL
uniref:SHANK associated RH domain interactor n=1 Tax=Gallus gallus TaxID=9031 RepID=A0A8V0YB76_CHICK